MDVWLQALGWIGSAILVTSLLQTRVLRLRQLNLGVAQRDGVPRSRGFRRVIAPRSMRQADAYLEDVGFRQEGPDRVLDLTSS